MEAEARHVYLDQACATDPTLRSEIDRLLRSLEEDTDLAGEAVRAGALDAVLSAGPAEISDRVGSYRLLRRIGFGGMGAVYLAERADEQFQQRVAIKLVRQEAGGRADLLRRFRMERQILAGLEHANIARLLDGGVTTAGVPYLAMEYIDGVPIDEYCSKRQLSLRGRIELFRIVCSAVQYAHRNLVIHRDIKPSNILVAADGVPKLLDFGIAKLLKAPSAGQTMTLTRPAERVMTVEYASPEQIRGEQVTTATDVYALGVVLYELLAASRPFSAGPDPTPHSYLELQRRICEAPPTRPSTLAAKAGRDQARALKGDLDNIVMKALRKEPEDRYSSVEQLSEDLRLYLDGFPVLASQGSRRYRLGKFVRRHRYAVAGGSLFALTLAGFGIGMAVLAARIRTERDHARVESARSAQVSAFLQDLFLSSDPYQSKGDTAAARRLLDEGAKRIARDLQGQPAVAARILSTIGQAYQNLGLLGDAEKTFRDGVRAEEQANGRDSLPVANMERQLADVERQRTNLAAAEADLRHALAVLTKVAPPNDMRLAHTLNNLALVLQTRGQAAEAEGLSERAAAISSQYPGEIRETLAMMSNLGSELSDCGRYAEAEKVLREVLARRRQLLGEDHPQVQLSKVRLGFLLARRGKYTEAEPLYRDALEHYGRLWGEHHIQTLAAMNNLALLLADTGRAKEAEALFRHLLEVARPTLGETADVAMWSSNLAGLLTDNGRLAEAGELFQKSLAICREKLGEGSVREARILARYAALLAAEHRPAEAEREFDQALAMARGRIGAVHPDIAQLSFDYGEMERTQGRREQAAHFYCDAVRIGRQALPPDDPQTAKAQSRFAEVAGAGVPCGDRP
jgi:serine/threonine-protein kinase